MTAPAPAHAPSWPRMEYVDVRTADGMAHQTRCWAEYGRWRWREVDQHIHPVHLGTPLEAWQHYGGQCRPDLCKPLPPGSMPGDRPVYPYLPEPPAIFRGPPE